MDHVPSPPRNAPDAPRDQLPMPPLGLGLQGLERWYVLETLKRVDGDRVRAARRLGISLRGLEARLRRYESADREPLSPAPPIPLLQRLGHHPRYYVLLIMAVILSVLVVLAQALGLL